MLCSKTKRICLFLETELKAIIDGTSSSTSEEILSKEASENQSEDFVFQTLSAISANRCLVRSYITIRSGGELPL